MRGLTVADEAWIATAQLHRETGGEAFTVTDIMGKVAELGLVQPLRPGVQQHLYQHGVGDKAARPNNLRYFKRTADGRRRLWLERDIADPSRLTGRTRPDRSTLPSQYHVLLDWYESEYLSSA